MKLMTPDLVALDANFGPTKADVIESLAGLVAAAGRADASGLAADALAREEKAATGVPGGIGIPHCRSAAVNTASLGFTRLAQPVDFGAKDGPADLVFLIAAAEDGDADHLKLLSQLARALVKKDFLASLRQAATAEEIVALVDGVLAPAASPARVAPSPAAEAAPTARPVIVGVTACPTGIAHTFMAADSLVAAGKEAGYDVQIETQGSGSVTPLPPEVISSAVATIFATDVGVRDRERFAGLPLIESGVKRAINEPAKMVAEAIAASKDPNARTVSGTASSTSTETGQKLSLGKRTMQALMTGVSYMIPFVAAGGLLIALGFAFGGFDIALKPGSPGGRTCAELPWAAADVCAKGASSIGTMAIDAGMAAGMGNFLGAILFAIGGAAFGFLLPALSGFIAFSIAGRPGIAPGFVGGAIAGTLGAGFLGAIVTGLIAGVIAQWIGSFDVPRWLRGLMPVVIIPLVATTITGGLMYLLLGKPLASITTGLQETLTGMSGGSAIVLGIVLGLMMGFDLGGPVNKAAYLFATAGLAANNAASWQVMAAVMAAGMVPPLAMALATTLRKNLFTENEVENGRAAWLLGASFISEGAIPFAAADPLRVIPSSMVGAAVTGAVSMAFAVGSRAPHGGIFVFFAISNIVGFIVSILIGTIVGAVLVIALKQLGAKKAVAA